MRGFHKALVCGCIAVGFSGCSSSGKSVKPDDMSRAEHEKEAAKEQNEAAEHRKAYDPAATATRSGGANAPETVRNPTEVQLDAAKAHELHAAQHRAAAQALAAFEDAICVGIAPPARAACPCLGGSVARVEDIKGGVHLVMAPGQRAEDLAQ